VIFVVKSRQIYPNESISEMKKLLSYLLIVLPILGFSQNTPSQEQFGANRVQYHRFDWKMLKTSNFEVYHYGAGTPLATLTAQYAESEFNRITELLSYTPPNQIKIFLYNSPQELLQSNIGLTSLGMLNENEMNLAKSRIEIAFTGDQVSFRSQLIREITRLYVFDMLYGGNIKDAIKNSILLSLPDWFMNGIAAYIADGWSTELDDYMRDAIARGNIKKPAMLNGPEATIVGQSIWNYIVERYGKENIAVILNLTRIIQNEQTSVASPLQISYTRFQKEWRAFYSGMATTTNESYKDIVGDWKTKTGAALSPKRSRVKISLENKFVAITSTKANRYTVEIANTDNSSSKVILKGKYLSKTKNHLTHTPLIAWQRGGGLAVITDEKEEIILRIFDISDKGESKLRLTRVIRDLNQVVDFDISNDGTTLALSAEREGHNDLYLFSVGRGSLAALTNDLYDDRYPHFVNGSTSRVVFCSNRTNDSLAVAGKGTYKTINGKLELFYHDGNPRSQVIKRVAEGVGHVSNPMMADENTFYFLSDLKGITNLYKYEVNIKRATQLTGFNQNIRNFDYLPNTGAFAAVNIQSGDEFATYQKQLSVASELPLSPRVQSLSGSPAYKTEQRANPVADAKMINQMANLNRIKLDSGEVDTDSYEFDADILKDFDSRSRNGSARRSSPAISSTSSSTLKSRRKDVINIKGPTDYKGLFIISDSRTDWKGDPVRGFGIAPSITINDLLENHIIKAGLFFSGNLRNSDIWAEYSNLAHRIDFTARYDRRSLYINESNVGQKYRYNRLAFTAAYPFTPSTKISVSPFFASTRLYDVNSLSSPDAAANYLGVRTEFVFDNSEINGMNMMEGSRMKIRYDFNKGINGTKGFNRLVIDLRHYQKIHRDLILATRFSFAQSGGESPKKSAVGGMENWLGYNKDSRSIDDPLTLGVNSQSLLPIDNRDIFFVEFAHNLRGFNINRISGTSHLVFNAELRIPLVKYLYHGPITSNFFRNLQLVAFSDIGTAWSGKNPLFNKKNTLNTEIVREDYFVATVNNFRNPFLVGYGAGVRTMVFGTYAKLDYAWGLDNGDILKPITYLTLGYDF
jgi:hypothetical protein